ncbi:sugar-transfer associated ATP-grasp domain-containing protein [Desulfurispira natronophila]|nr:sugar-transfer associated ATP-grasp domain-containing protein [Desulfurispira natronophila]
MPENYYKFEWYLKNQRKRAKEYRHRYEVKNILYKAYRPGKHQEVPPSITNKVKFAAHAKKCGLPVPETLAVIKNGVVSAKSNKLLQKVKCDLFVKPIEGKGGRNANRLEYMEMPSEEVLFRDTFKNKISTLDKILDSYKKRSKSHKNKDGYLVQPCLANHSSIKPYTGRTVSTCRVITIVNEKDTPEVVAAAFRMPSNPQSVVDNIHAGGFSSPIDITSGKLGKASFLGVSGNLGQLEIHPESNARIEDFTLPYWSEVIKLCKQAHTSFMPRMIIGWDICITEDGPIIIEGNAQPCPDHIQRVHRAPLGNERFGQLLAFHIKKTMQGTANNCRIKQ